MFCAIAVVSVISVCKDYFAIAVNQPATSVPEINPIMNTLQSVDKIKSAAETIQNGSDPASIVGDTNSSAEIVTSAVGHTPLSIADVSNSLHTVLESGGPVLQQASEVVPSILQFSAWI